MKTSHTPAHRGFTLVELITAMAITVVLVFVIMQLTSQSIRLWKSMQDDSNATVTSSMALQTLSRDMEAFQMRAGSDNHQWFYAEVDKAMAGLPRGLKIPKSARCIFFSCTPDINPPVGAKSSQRNSYREKLASNTDTQGDVSAVAYRLLFRDQILNLPGTHGNKQSFPLFSLYRQVISPRETYDYLLGQNDLKSAYQRYEATDDKHFLCDNIVELSLVFNVEYADDRDSTREDHPTYKTITVPILSSSARDGERHFLMYSNRAMVGGGDLKDARIVSAEISMTVLTEEGVALVEQVRQGQRHAPKIEEFFSRYTKSFVRSVNLPQPL